MTRDQHFPYQSYSMRNGVLGVIGEIVSKVLSKEELDERGKKSRDRFLDILEVRTRAFCPGPGCPKPATPRK